ncbi:hypothetical protein ACFYY8_33795 [Streptosporangium sp. NPDC001559]|uniref:hypothetical protein n=1 Tax=Streptosporangium sp. NPDC001559 TaxID=3366187 RepID=UPI0036E92716
MTIDTVNHNSPARAQAAPTKVSVPLAKPLSSLDQVWRLAGNLGQSSLLPASLTKNPKTTQANVTLILLYGAELGLAPMQSIQEIYVVNGRPQISGRLWLAKVREAGHRVEKIEHTAEVCTIKITRGDTGEDWEETFTIEDARRAKLLSKDTYQQHPKRMLLWRAVANCATAICPEVAMGFGAELPEPDQPNPAPEVALAVAVDARTRSTPAEPEDTVDADLVEDEPSEEELRQELLELAAQHTRPDGVPADYECICGALGEHFEDECPTSGAVR